MARYFLEVAYKGTHYSGFQIQQNANTIQAEVEKAFKTLFRSLNIPTPSREVRSGLLTGSSRTDAGVHALQNFFHFDLNEQILPNLIYNINALLPADIAAKSIYLMPDNAHSRFDAISREYEYRMYKFKDPFQEELAYYYPYKLDVELLRHATSFVKSQTNFYAFTKTKTDVKNFSCAINKSEWIFEQDQMIYHIGANRFLRGMIRLLTATLLQVARKKISLEHFFSLFSTHQKCGLSVPAHGLYLTKVVYAEGYLCK